MMDRMYTKYIVSTRIYIVLISEVNKMLTSRQEKVLALIIQQFNKTEEPVGSRSLLQNSDLNVSSATIRNDMATLEKAGYLKKLHTSSGRAPSMSGYRHYVQQLIQMKSEHLPLNIEVDIFEAIVNEKTEKPIQKAQLVSELVASITGYTTFVIGQNEEEHYFERFRLVRVDSDRYMGIIITRNGDVGNQLFEIQPTIEQETITTINDLINRELFGLTLSEAYQRLKLTIPLILQRHIGYQYDFSPLIEKAKIQLMGHDYFVSGKENLYQLIDHSMSPESISSLMSLVEGSSQSYRLIEKSLDGVDVQFGYDFSPNVLDNINLITGTYHQNNQRITLGVIGPVNMGYADVILLLDKAIEKLAD